MKFAFVTPRYGAEIASGIEHACRLLAELSVARRIEAVHEALASILLDLALRERNESEAAREPLN